MQLSTVMTWVCSTVAAIAMQRWVWAGQTAVVHKHPNMRRTQLAR